MSCLHFNTEPMRQQLLKANAADPVAQFLSPQLTEAKIHRLVKMSKDPNHKIREAVAMNYHTPKMTLWELSIDVEPSVRECVARNPYTSLGVLLELAEDSSERVRASIAYNTSTPRQTLEKLANDESPLVSHIAKMMME